MNIYQQFLLWLRHSEQLRQFNESAQREQQNRESVPIESTKPVIKFAFVLGLITGLGLGSGLTFLAMRPSPEQVKACPTGAPEGGYPDHEGHSRRLQHHA